MRTLVAAPDSNYMHLRTTLTALIVCGVGVLTLAKVLLAVILYCVVGFFAILLIGAVLFALWDFQPDSPPATDTPEK